MYITTAFGNGLFEETIWQGTFYDQFSDRPWIQMGWASLGFALWHYAPGSISGSGAVWTLMGGAFFLGLLLSYLSKRSGSIGCSIIAHTVIGLITIL
jgi:membrane protease YdiL (CAAX protease family)